MSEHAVIVSFRCDTGALNDLFDLEEQLETVIEEASVGEFDGNELAMDGADNRLYMYGPDADALYNAVEETLLQASFLGDANVLKRYGPPEDGVQEITIKLHKSDT